ncbi:MAG: diphthine--ammonia ligase [Candidatus Micrarchaeota archaeon]|nr:diphthine--ammonia ligase [Candidatus Micrarchaeota archaeon]
MKFALLCSGGKDGWFAAWCAVHSGLEMVNAITVIPTNPDSELMHSVNSKFVGEQARSAGIGWISREAGEGEELRVLEELIGRAKTKGVEAIVSGAVESEYQKRRFEIVCEKAGVRSFSPLWRKNQKTLLDDEIAIGIEATIVSVSAEGLGKEMLGGKLSECKTKIMRAADERGVSPIGEGGEFETFVCDCPLFSCPLEVVEKEVDWHGTSGRLNITKLVAKSPLPRTRGI